MKLSRGNIEAAKARLPLPALLERLGFTPPAGAEGGDMNSPFAKGRKQKSPSFSIFRRGDSWGWFDRSGGQESKGDEIGFLERLEGLSKGDAIARYCALAGIETAHPAAPERKAAAPAGPFDWVSCVEKFAPAHAARLCKWRGYSPAFVDWLKSQSLVGVVGDGTAFPVSNAAGVVLSAHVRPPLGNWFYSPKGRGGIRLSSAKLRPLERSCFSKVNGMRSRSWTLPNGMSPRPRAGQSSSPEGRATENFPSWPPGPFIHGHKTMPPG